MGYVDAFKKYLQEDGKSETTALSYVRDVTGFVTFLAEKESHLLVKLQGSLSQATGNI